MGLDREIVDFLGVAAFDAGLGREHLLDRHLAHDHRSGAIPIGLGELDAPFGESEAQVMLDKRAEEVAGFCGNRRNGHTCVSPFELVD